MCHARQLFTQTDNAEVSCHKQEPPSRFRDEVLIIAHKTGRWGFSRCRNWVHLSNAAKQNVGGVGGLAVREYNSPVTESHETLQHAVLILPIGRTADWGSEGRKEAPPVDWARVHRTRGKNKKE